MVKKVVATLKDKSKKGVSKIYIPVKSSKTGSYLYKKVMAPLDDVEKVIQDFKNQYDKSV